MNEGQNRYPYVHVQVSTEDAEDASSILWALGALGIEERDDSTLDKPESGSITLVANFATEDVAQVAATVTGERWPAVVRFVEGDAWRDAWKAYFKPVRMGQRLLIRPSWEQVSPKNGDVVLTLDPGNAFGSGTHATTQLVLQQVDARVRGGESVLDVGCGSGILSIAALLLGANRALAIDVDPDAVRVTLENAEHNGVRSRIEASTLPIEQVGDEFDLVLANIEALTLECLSEPIASRVRSEGILVLSGILRGQEERIQAAYSALELISTHTQEDWVAMIYRRT